LSARTSARPRHRARRHGGRRSSGCRRPRPPASAKILAIHGVGRGRVGRDVRLVALEVHAVRRASLPPSQACRRPAERAGRCRRGRAAALRPPGRRHASWKRLQPPDPPTLDRELQLRRGVFDGVGHGVEMSRNGSAAGREPPREALEGAGLTAYRTGCSNPPYRAAGGAAAKERAGGMHRRLPDPMAFAPGTGRAAPGAR
jgi:hypothetical protein